MIYTPQKMNFRKVIRNDTFEVTLIIGDEYPITSGTDIQMQVRPVGDIGDTPVLTFDQASSTLTANGQEITLHQDSISAQPGRYMYDIQFTTDGTVTTLVRGIFEIISDLTL